MTAPGDVVDPVGSNDMDTVETTAGPPANLIFYDGFESGDTGAWTKTEGALAPTPER